MAAWDEFLDRAGVPKQERNTRSALIDPDGHCPRIFFQQVPENKTAKTDSTSTSAQPPGLQGEQRMAAPEAESERLIALGATTVHRFEPQPPTSLGFIVMTDPEGNEFCLD